MSISDAAQREVIVHPEGLPIFPGELGREEYRSLVAERNQASVEGCIEMGGEQEAVIDVKPLGVGFAFGPRLDMAGAQEARLGDAGYGTASSPIG